MSPVQTPYSQQAQNVAQGFLHLGLEKPLKIFPPSLGKLSHCLSVFMRKNVLLVSYLAFCCNLPVVLLPQTTVKGLGLSATLRYWQAVVSSIQNPFFCSEMDPLASLHRESAPDLSILVSLWLILL